MGSFAPKQKISCLVWLGFIVSVAKLLSEKESKDNRTAADSSAFEVFKAMITIRSSFDSSHFKMLPKYNLDGNSKCN